MCWALSDSTSSQTSTSFYNVKKAKLSSCADHKQLCFSHKDVRTVQDTLNSKLATVSSWISENGLLNAKKSEPLSFTRSKLNNIFAEIIWSSMIRFLLSLLLFLPVFRRIQNAKTYEKWLINSKVEVYSRTKREGDQRRRKIDSHKAFMKNSTFWFPYAWNIVESWLIHPHTAQFTALFSVPPCTQCLVLVIHPRSQPVPFSCAEYITIST